MGSRTIDEPLEAARDRLDRLQPAGNAFDEARYGALIAYRLYPFSEDVRVADATGETVRP